MGLGCFVTICATMIQTFSPKGNLGAFMAGRVIVGIGQGMALSEWTHPSPPCIDTQLTVVS